MATFRQWTYRNLYLRSPYWKWIRTIIGRRAGWKCEVQGCHQWGHNLDCHHTTYKVMWFEWLFPCFLVYLCREHHNATHNGETLTLRFRGKLQPFKRYS